MDLNGVPIIFECTEITYHISFCRLGITYVDYNK